MQGCLFLFEACFHLIDSKWMAEYAQKTYFASLNVDQKSMFGFSLKRILSKRELQREKQKDYRNVVLIQIIIVVFGLTLSEPLLANSHSTESKLIISIFSFLVQPMHFCCGIYSEILTITEP